MAVVLLLMLFVGLGQADEAENKAAAAKTAQGTVTAVSYTHLTLPTILRV